MNKLFRTFEEMSSLTSSLMNDTEIQIKAAKLFLEYAQECVKQLAPVLRIQSKYLINESSFALYCDKDGFKCGKFGLEGWQADFEKVYEYDRENFWRAVKAISIFIIELKERLKDVQELRDEVLKELDELGFLEEATERERSWSVLFQQLARKNLKG